MVVCPCCCDNKTRERLFVRKDSSLFFHALCGNLGEIERLISQGVDVNEVEDSLEETALMLCCGHGHLSVAKALLDSRADPNYARKEDGATALFFACRSGHEAVVSALVEAGARINISCGKVESSWTPLTVACDENHLGVVKVLLRGGADVELCDADFDYPPLFFAVQTGNVELVDELLKFGARVDRSAGRATPLTVACSKNQLAIVKRLIEAGASVSQTSEPSKASPLMQAAFVGSDVLVSYLLQAGADVDLPVNSIGATALMTAARDNHVNVVRRLLIAGASIDRKSLEGQTALYCAAKASSVEMTELLLSAGACVDACCNELQTPLMQAIVGDNVEVAKVLISAGADVLAKDATGMCPLSQAVSSRAVQLLLKSGASVQSTDQYGNNALHLVIMNKRNNGVLISLLKAGCDAHATNSMRDTPMQLGMKVKHFSEVENFEKILSVFQAGGLAAVELCDRCGEYPAKPCGACKQVYYCGVKCQKACWSSHKVACKAVSSKNSMEK